MEAFNEPLWIRFLKTDKGSPASGRGSKAFCIQSISQLELKMALDPLYIKPLAEPEIRRLSFYRRETPVSRQNLSLVLILNKDQKKDFDHEISALKNLPFGLTINTAKEGAFASVNRTFLCKITHTYSADEIQTELSLSLEDWTWQIKTPDFRASAQRVDPFKSDLDKGTSLVVDKITKSEPEVFLSPFKPVGINRSPSRSSLIAWFSAYFPFSPDPCVSIQGEHLLCRGVVFLRNDSTDARDSSILSHAELLKKFLEIRTRLLGDIEWIDEDGYATTQSVKRVVVVPEASVHWAGEIEACSFSLCGEIAEIVLQLRTINIL